MIKKIAQYAVKLMKNKWGGDLPTWEDYKLAYTKGKVRANKTVAVEAIHLNQIPKLYFYIYGILTIWTAFLLVPAILLAWLFVDISAWWIIVSIIAAWVLYKISRTGYCYAMKRSAYRNKELYVFLINQGAFLFDPPNNDK